MVDMEGKLVPLQAVMLACFPDEGAMYQWLRKECRKLHQAGQFVVWDRNAGSPYQIWEVRKDSQPRIVTASYRRR